MAKKHNYVKKTNNVMSCKERKTLKSEMARQLPDLERQYADDIDAEILYVLHEDFGFGVKRLRKFYEAVKAKHTELQTHYQLGADTPWIYKTRLKEIGVDIEAWNLES